MTDAEKIEKLKQALRKFTVCVDETGYIQDKDAAQEARRSGRRLLEELEE